MTSVKINDCKQSSETAFELNWIFMLQSDYGSEWKIQ